MTSGRVRGALFVDYVRMIRARKDIEWSRWLEPGDLALVAQHVDLDGWYSMDVFERLGDAILATIGGGDLQAVRAWGRRSVDHLRDTYPNLVVPNDPRESLMRFQVVRQTFFDFTAVAVQELSDLEARLRIAYDMAPRAESAAAFQVMGFFEHLLELAGAERVQAGFLRRRWEGDPDTLLSIKWERPSAAPGLPGGPRRL